MHVWQGGEWGKEHPTSHPCSNVHTIWLPPSPLLQHKSLPPPWKENPNPPSCRWNIITPLLQPQPVPMCGRRPAAAAAARSFGGLRLMGEGGRLCDEKRHSTTFKQPQVVLLSWNFFTFLAGKVAGGLGQCVQMLWVCAKVAHFDPLSPSIFESRQCARNPKVAHFAFWLFKKIYALKSNLFFQKKFLKNPKVNPLWNVKKFNKNLHFWLTLFLHFEQFPVHFGKKLDTLV